VKVWAKGRGRDEEREMRDEEKLLVLAASAEQGSLHPIARGILQAARERNLTLLQPLEVRTEVGRGVHAKFKTGELSGTGTGSLEAETEVFVGKLEDEDLPTCQPAEFRDGGRGTGDEDFDGGWSLVGVWLNGELIGCIALADELKGEAVEAVRRLKGMGIKVYLATGDKPQVAMRVADKLGCDGVLSLATPQRKAQFVRELQNEGERVLMVGDGVNDAVALSQADIGVAVATGADLTAQAADALMVTDKLTVLPEFLKLARRARRVMAQNLFWAFAYNMAALPLAAAGKLNPMIAAAAMALSSVTVVGNALRLRFGSKD